MCGIIRKENLKCDVGIFQRLRDMLDPHSIEKQIVSKQLLNRAKFPHSAILHYTCGSMCVVLCFATKKQQKQRIVPQLLHSFCHYFPLTMTCMHNEEWGCAEI